MGVEEHRKHAVPSVRCAVLTVSDTRTEATDDAGRILRDGLEAAGHRVVRYAVVRDEIPAVVSAVATVPTPCDVVLVNGGTGLAARDVTLDALDPLFDRRLPGFGELFRALSYRAIGPAAMLSRAAAGVVGGRLVFCLPGAPEAVKLALDRLILPELGHMVAEVRRR
jgi:molybdenum cofactor biosynthesis protein B